MFKVYEGVSILTLLSENEKEGPKPLDLLICSTKLSKIFKIKRLDFHVFRQISNFIYCTEVVFWIVNDIKIYLRGVEFPDVFIRFRYNSFIYSEGFALL